MHLLQLRVLMEYSTCHVVVTLGLGKGGQTMNDIRSHLSHYFATDFILLPQMTLSNEDRRDIEQSFHVLDDDRVGTISMDHFYTLWLGLGFDDAISQADLAAHVPQDRHEAITLEDVHRIASCVSNTRFERKSHDSFSPRQLFL